MRARSHQKVSTWNGIQIFRKYLAWKWHLIDKTNHLYETSLMDSLELKQTHAPNVVDFWHYLSLFDLKFEMKTLWPSHITIVKKIYWKQEVVVGQDPLMLVTYVTACLITFSSTHTLYNRLLKWLPIQVSTSNTNPVIYWTFELKKPSFFLALERPQQVQSICSKLKISTNSTITASWRGPSKDCSFVNE